MINKGKGAEGVMGEKILVVDDALFMRVTLRNILNANGYEQVLEAKDGEEALKVYEQERPELVLMDISMPVMDGIEALKNIRRIDEKAVVVMCSAVGQEAMILEAVQSGASDFIVKPFEPEHIVMAVQKYLGSTKG